VLMPDTSPRLRSGNSSHLRFAIWPWLPSWRRALEDAYPTLTPPLPQPHHRRVSPVRVIGPSAERHPWLFSSAGVTSCRPFAVAITWATLCCKGAQLADMVV
jgi:hypothetical protein